MDAQTYLNWNRARRRRAEIISSLLTVLAAVIAAGVAFIYFGIGKNSFESRPTDRLATEQSIAALQGHARSLDAAVKRLTLERTNGPTTNVGESTQRELKHLQHAVGDLELRLARFEAAVSSNPERVLAVPLMRKDLDSLKADVLANYAAAKDGVDRIYDLSKWLLGVLSVSIFSLALSSLFKSRDLKRSD